MPSTIAKGSVVVLTRGLEDAAPSALLKRGSPFIGIEGEVVHIYSLGEDILGFDVEFGGGVGRRSVTRDMVKPARSNRRRPSASSTGLKSWEKELILAAGRGDGAAFSTLIYHARRSRGLAARAMAFWERERDSAPLK